MADAVIVLDTSILSLVLLRRPAARNERISDFFRGLLITRRMAVPGIVAQELLSGVHEAPGRARLRQYLASFPCLLAEAEDHHLGAEIFTACREGGVQAGTMDALIAAQAIRLGAEVLATDRDFSHMLPHVPKLLLVQLPADLVP